MMSSTMYAGIILPLPMRQLYTYRVPADLRAEALPGKRVVVQFGQRKMYTGLIRKICEEPPVEEGIKNILDIPDEAPLVSETQFRFWEWMADYYMCTMGEIFRAALPSGLKLESESRVLVNPAYSGEMSERDRLLMHVLSENNGLPVGSLSRAAGRKDIHRSLLKLMEKGAVIIEEHLKENYKPLKEIRVGLHPSLNDPEKIHQTLDDLSRAHRQKEALNEILSSVLDGEDHIRSAGIPLTSLTSRYSMSVINSLVEKKIVLKTEKRTGRLESYGGQTHPPFPLDVNQQQALDEINESFREKNVVLLHGVTSSGKTEVYIHLIQQYLEQGKQVLYLLPEIALTSQIVGRLQRVFGDDVGIYHSKFNDAERVEVYLRLHHKGEKQYRLILGVRSAIFLPFDNLGLVIVDEEHENTFKQQDPAPRYHARDAAVVLSSLYGARVLMGTATPSVETYTNALNKKYGLTRLTGRYGNMLMPEIRIADVQKARKRREMKSVFTPVLLNEIEKTLQEGKQVILFQNRRGYSSFLECSNCGYIPKCRKCDVSLTYHRYDERLVCHYCGYAEKIPAHCPECLSPAILTRGFGTELVEDEIALRMPGVTVARLDLDTSRSRKAYEKILADFAAGRYQILAGTQMLSKGLDFENVELVGILNADQMLNYPDFRAFERSYQLMAQVSGRAGRKNRQGKVIIQTSDPSHPVIRYVLDNDYEGMYRDQIMERQAFAYPPFVRLVKITLRSREKRIADAVANDLAGRLKEIFGRRVLGPQPPLVGRIKNQFLNQIILKIEKKASFARARKLLQEVIDDGQRNRQFKKVRINIDVDPM